MPTETEFGSRREEAEEPQETERARRNGKGCGAGLRQADGAKEVEKRRSDRVDQDGLQCTGGCEGPTLVGILGSTKVGSNARVAARGRPWSGFEGSTKVGSNARVAARGRPWSGFWRGRPRWAPMHGWLRGADLGRDFGVDQGGLQCTGGCEEPTLVGILLSTKVGSNARVAARGRPWSESARVPTIEGGVDQGRKKGRPRSQKGSTKVGRISAPTTSP